MKFECLEFGDSCGRWERNPNRQEIIFPSPAWAEKEQE
jgi:hypothetical protein